MAPSTSTSTYADAPMAPDRLLRLELKSVLITILLGSLCVLILYPPFMLVLNSFQLGSPGDPTREFGLRNWIEAARQPGLIEAIRNTVVLTLLLQLIAFPIAV